jgi:hypothetical protein
MDISTFQNQLLFFPEKITNTSFQTLIEADSVYYCISAEYSSMYSNGLKKTRHHLVLQLQNAPTLHLIENDHDGLVEAVKGSIIPVKVMHQAYLAKK